MVKSTGDGLLATFADPADATHAAKGVVAAAAGLGLQVTAGVHTGQCELCLACGPSCSEAGATSTAVISGSGVWVTAAFGSARVTLIAPALSERLPRNGSGESEVR